MAREEDLAWTSAAWRAKCRQRSSAQRREARQRAVTSAHGALVRMREQAAALSEGVAALSSPEVRLRLVLAAPALEALCCRRAAHPADRLKRNVAMHAERVPPATAPISHWRRAQKEARLGTAPAKAQVPAQHGTHHEADCAGGAPADQLDTFRGRHLDADDDVDLELIPAPAGHPIVPEFHLDDADVAHYEAAFFGQSLEGHSQGAAKTFEASTHKKHRRRRKKKQSSAPSTLPTPVCMVEQTISGEEAYPDDDNISFYSADEDTHDDRELWRPGWAHSEDEVPTPCAVGHRFVLSAHWWPALDTTCLWCGSFAFGEKWCTACTHWWVAKLQAR